MADSVLRRSARTVRSRDEHRRRGASRAASGAVVLALALTACGQKAGVHVEGSDGFGLAAPVAAPVTTGETTTFDQSTAPDASADASADTSTDTTTTVQPASTGQTAPQPSGQAQTTGQQPAAQAPAPGQSAAPKPASPSGQQRQVRGNDRTGVTADVLKLGTHAPVTGAAPLPSTSFEKSGDLYWRNKIDRKGETVLGRTKVEYLFRDDRYDPNSARQVCRELNAEAFIFAGGGGTDQIQACGEFAARVETPYFSAGVTEAGLRGNKWYFAASMSYKQQGPLLAQFIKKWPDFQGKKVAAIVTDTPNFDDAVAGWEAGVQQQGLNYYKTLRHPKGDTSWYSSYANDLQANGVEVLFILSSPVDYIRLAQKATENGYDLNYVGVGLSMGLNAVLNSGCNHVDGGIFFSPFPGMDWARQNAPEYFEAGAHFGVPTDDIAFALWGISASLDQMLARYGQVYGNDLTREDFRDLVENSTFESGVFPTVKYSPDNHFGATSVHVLQADCAAKEYKTIKTFASAF